MSKLTQPTVLVIFGITSDLATRKLLPAIREIADAGMLPRHFRIIGTIRRELALEEVIPGKEDIDFWRGKLELHHMDMSDQAAYDILGTRLAELEQSFDEPAQRLFYLAVPPQVSPTIITMLGTSGIAQAPHGKLLLEKPFGTDLASAQNLVDHIKTYFDEEQVYRIDHFLAKEMAQNLLVFRGSNSLFKRTWNHEFIESITVEASEIIGIEGRAAFYEQTGALRDVVQSHLMQLTALVLMDLPGDNWQAIPVLRLKALQALQPPRNIAAQAVRSQYKGYRHEVSNPRSNIETFASLTLRSTDPRWKGVPITITTGKALKRKSTEIRIRYRREDAREANELNLHIQPNEGAEICLWTKKPGFEREVRKLSLDFSYKAHYGDLPDAYARVFVDAMRSDHSLFATNEEVLASWRILEPIQQAWRMDGDDLIIYEPGSSPESITG